MVTFAKEVEPENVYAILRERVNLFLKENQLSAKASLAMVLKSLFLMGMMALFYSLIVGQIVSGYWIILTNVFLGFFIAISALNIIHDALHGAYVSNTLGNRCLGFVMDLYGASSFYWKIEHTVDHHTFTNIVGHDHDISVSILRLCPHIPHRANLKYQHIYAPFLYCLKFFQWVYITDTKRLIAVIKGKQTPKQKISRTELFFFVLFKLIHLSVFVVAPLIFANGTWWQILIGYGVCLFSIGFTLMVIFQLAHVVENVAFPLPNPSGKIDSSFLYHQLSTTSNFGTKNPLTTFLCGGLNFQVEHHLFPHISHLLLPKIAPIVKACAKEFGLPYHEVSSFFAAFKSHIRTLKKLGAAP